MRKPEVKEADFFKPAKFVLLLLIAALPLAVTTITHNQSDLPKSVTLIILASLFCILAVFGVFMEFVSRPRNTDGIKLSFFPKLDIPVIMFLAAAALSTIFSINSYTSYYGQYERQIGLITIIYFFLIYFSSALLRGKESFFLKIVLAMELTALAVSIYAIMQQLGIDPLSIQPFTDTRPVTTIGNAVFAGGFLAMVLPISAFNISEKKNAFIRIIIPAVILAGIVVTRTRSAYIAVFGELIVILLLFLFNRSNENNGKLNIKKIIYFLGGGILILLILVIVLPENIFIKRLVSIFSGADNPRWMIWRDAFGIFGKYPFTGPGIGTFPNAFAEFYSYELRYQDVLRYVDNAHNNYLQILFTMGAIGLGSYLILLVSAFSVCISQISGKNRPAGGGKKAFYYTAIFSSLAGYCAYGLTNFDELTMMLYFTVILVLIRAGIQGKVNILLKKNSLNKAAAGIIFTAVSVFAVLNSIDALRVFFADVHFLKGEKFMKSNDLKNGINEMNTAVILKPKNPAYRYMLAENVFLFMNINRNMNETVRKDLLNEAAAEVIEARNNHSNTNDCDGLLSLIYFESGKKSEAEELKRKVLEADGVNIFYRLNLAYLYINHKDLKSANEQIEEINKIGFKSTNFWFIQSLYFYNAGSKTEASKFCRLILDKEPNNHEALELKKLILQMP